MVADSSAAQMQRTAIRRRTMAALRELPTRSPVPPAPHDAAVTWQQCSPARYVVRRGESVLGHVDVVGAVFVAIAGARYDRATEVVQTLVFADAIAALTRAAE